MTAPGGPPLETWFPSPFQTTGSSFAALLGRPDGGSPLPASLREQLVDGTTVLALLCRGGIVMAGDRRATSGHLISRSDMRKVFPADRHSAVAISGAAGPSMEMARLLATELEHYEKVEGEPLSLEGKSNRLAGLVRQHLPLALQGLVVVPLFAGVDATTGVSGIFEYDPVGGRYQSTEYAASGSGALMARQALRHRWDPDDEPVDAARTAVAALVDAAAQDSATGGPDLVRSIWPIVAVVDLDGYRELATDDVGELVEQVVAERRAEP